MQSNFNEHPSDLFDKSMPSFVETEARPVLFPFYKKMGRRTYMPRG